MDTKKTKTLPFFNWQKYAKEHPEADVPELEKFLDEALDEMDKVVLNSEVNNDEQS
jgi:hypothetical protein|tara:strand:+ start:1081 stop:1248 length:168 start_codon:yes stop_codon:yes gene_type:complete